MLSNNKFFVGIDLGGTQIKGGIVNTFGEVLVQDKCDTESHLGNEQVIKNIVKLTENLLDKANLNLSDVSGMGVGVPGIIDSKRGLAVCAHNLNFKNFNIKNKLESVLGISVNIINDANAFTLAEYFYGQGKGKRNIIAITLGTGVGGGAIVEGNLLLGNNSAGAEFGHMVIEFCGKECSCGRLGCLEQYVSANALKNDTIESMKTNPKSKMWEIGSLDKVTAKLAFDYYKSDKTAKEVVDRYINYLVCGLVNIANIFRPEIIILGGGVSKQGKNLSAPVESKLNELIYSSSNTPKVKVVTSNLGDSAGVLGSIVEFISKPL